MGNLNIFASLLALAAAAPVMAQDKAAAEEATGPWSGNVSAGYLATTGNAESSSANFDFEAAYTSGAWNHALSGRAFGASADDETTAEAYQAGWKSTYDFNERNYAFGALDWNANRFAGFTRQTFATLGYGRRVLTGSRFFLNLEVGVGYAKQKPKTGDSQSGGSGTLGAEFIWALSDTSEFSQRLNVFATSDNTFSESISKVSTSLIGNVALAVSYTVRRNTDVPPDTQKTDTLTAISLEYGF